ncbi:TrkA family potassium uptake protein [Fusobacterium simiae]|uniref:TrkA family potassium uptake protein n=1 Tax=Fusobacterium simiae TaxID=855 RepID=A0ABT4DGV5_FUSSI|nr:TrkA family potassium uptake protein [Fusobacterium simiae]MCY7007829.1 TrkA family potassium uptake protein [Fusobacterium simiae]
MKQYLVIGLGRFGASVAKTLYNAGEIVLGVDISEELVQDKIDNNVLKNAIIGDASDEKILKDIGAENFDIAFVCIGDIEASVMIALNLKELGIKSIIAKAINKKHGKVLTKIGATEIVYPEEHMGKRIAELTMNTDIIEHLKFTDDFVLVEIKAPSIFWNNSLIKLDVRNKYNINVVGIKKSGGKFIPNPTANIIIEEGDILVVITDRKTVKSFNDLI